MKKLTAIIICLLIALFPVVSSASYSTGLVVDDIVIFDAWRGSGDIQVKVDTSDYSHRVNPEEFEYVRYSNNIVDEHYYTVEYGENYIIFTLQEEFLASLKNGTYHLNMNFELKSIRFLLYVFTEKAVVDNVVLFDFDDMNPIIMQFDELQGSVNGDRIPVGATLFESISYNGEKIDEKFYSVYAVMQYTFIQFEKSFYDSLPAGIHLLDIEFSSVTGIKIKIDIQPRKFAGDVATVSYIRDGFKKSVCYIDNDFFKDYHDAFFKEMCANYATMTEAEKIADGKMKNGMYNKVKNFIDEEFYFCLYLKDTEVDASAVAGVTEVKYTSEKYPCAVVKVVGGGDIDLIIADENVEYVGYAFDFAAPFWGDPGWSMKRIYTASDARKVLRISAGLEKFDYNENYSAIDEYLRFFALDMDNDGRLTANDARSVLRTAAGLDETKDVVYPY